MKKAVTILIVAIVAFAAGFFLQSTFFFKTTSVTTSAQQTKHAKRKPLYWVAPMDPSYRRDKPGKSPMGMDLVPVYKDDKQDEQQGGIKISPAVVNNLGVETVVVKRMNLPRIINTVGIVTVDENGIEHVHTFVSGWVKKLYVNVTGQQVKRGQLLFEIYSPEVVNAQDEFLMTLKNKDPTLIHAGERKLLTLGVPQSQIDEIKKSRRSQDLIRVYAPRSGIVAKLDIREGMYVKPETTIMTIENLAHIWIIGEVFERQANWVKVGQTAFATFPYMPDKLWQGKVEYVYPQLDSTTHTLRVRLTFPNPNLLIKPNMYANVKIFAKGLQNVLAIPRSAVIRTGAGDHVILALGNGRFRPQFVRIGIESGDKYAVLSGLKAGERVVVSAQFLIDSESNVRSGFKRMDSRVVSKQPGKVSTQKEIIGMGIVKSVDYRARLLKLRHEPIPALNMGVMDMELIVANNINIQKIKKGDRVHFTIETNQQGQYVIVQIQVVDASQEKHND